MTRSPRRLKQQVQDTVGEQVRDLPLHAVRLAMFGVGRALLLGDRMTRDYKEITEGGGVKPVIGRLRDDVQHTAEKVVGTVVERVRGGEDAGPEPEPVRPRRTRPARPSRPSRPSAAREDGAPVRRPGGEIAVGKPGASDGPAAKPAPSPRPTAPRPEPAPQAEPAAPPVPDGGPAPKSAETAAPDAPVPDAPKASDAPKADAAERESAKSEDEFAPRPESRPAAQSEAEHVVEDLPVPNYDEATLPQLRARLRGLSAEQVKLLREYERTHAAREDIIKMYERRIAKLNGQG
ncbi:hypothetical protein [Actinomadura algeriensis]|uniref:DUF8129 domain-containing protein n=1 Tax=Actinomadura algeriensis TaxID=1679523 RepID=A0ABR9JUB9_9ACTN|nr:hypothetical protein [Actinomadura algeriensis]MBE1534155.1 hypothetical protein [Actinomadura algeriensis]